MEITIDYLQQAFSKYNALMFEGKLPLPVLKLSKARTHLGQIAYKRRKSWMKTKLYDFTISVSTYYNLSQAEIDDVMIHEMIHYYIVFMGIKDTSSHGLVFRKMMSEINRKYGRHLSISAKTMGMETTAPPKLSAYLVLALEMKDGTRYLSSVNPSFARKLSLSLSRIPNLASHSWYTSSDSFFQNMPRVRSFRGRKVSKEVFDELIGKMSPVD
nr:SprT-like domain-containing protein [Prevotella sp. HUN102]